jgi:hypothetical protein
MFLIEKNREKNVSKSLFCIVFWILSQNGRQKFFHVKHQFFMILTLY